MLVQAQVTLECYLVLEAGDDDVAVYRGGLSLGLVGCDGAEAHYGKLFVEEADPALGCRSAGQGP